MCAHTQMLSSHSYMCPKYNYHLLHWWHADHYNKRCDIAHLKQNLLCEKSRLATKLLYFCVVITFITFENMLQDYEIQIILLHLVYVDSICCSFAPLDSFIHTHPHILSLSLPPPLPVWYLDIFNYIYIFIYK